LLKSKLEKFVAKRVLIFFVILAILDMVLIKEKWLVLSGLLIGGAFSVFRFGSYSMLFTNLLTPTSDGNTKKHAALKSTLIFILNQSILLLLLFLAMKISSWYFAGIVAGILLVPFVLLVNGITEALSITHNNFE